MNIRNIVATAKSHVVLDLDFIHSLLPSDLCYRSSSFGSLNLQDDFRTLFQLFKNGNVVVIGGNDENEAKNIFDGYVSQLNYLGIGITFSGYKIRNIIATYKQENKINLSLLANTQGLFYEPELFPAVRYRNNRLKITVNIFHTGSCVFLGASSFADLDVVASEVKNLLCSV